MSAYIEHVALVKKGKVAIEEWKKKHPDESLELSGSDLSRINLSLANLELAKLSETNLSETNLSKAEFFAADLSGANLFKANLFHANLELAFLLDADLTEASLWGADLYFTMLVEAKFKNSNLSYATIIEPVFLETDLTNAIMNTTILGMCDLSQVNGLETVRHKGPSIIGISTLISSFRNAGNRLTSELNTFFINAGVPKELLDALPQIVAEVKYFTTFVGYGQPDVEFAETLVKNLRARGVPCWLYSLDYTPGERTWKEINRRRREAEKVIVLCSAESLIRDGLLKELEVQIDEDPNKMVPVSLDNLWIQRGFRVIRVNNDLKPFLIDRNYADFSDNSKYEDSLKKLLKALER